jgi:hypothetical protein
VESGKQTFFNDFAGFRYAPVFGLSFLVRQLPHFQPPFLKIMNLT